MSKVIGALIVLMSLVFSSCVLADSAVYEVSKGKQKLYLAGTLHLLRDQDFPLPAEFDAAYQQAQKVYFETDLQKAKDPAFGQRFAQAMLLPDNKTLKDILAPDVWEKLQSYSVKNQYPLKQTMTYNPVMTGILITLTESKKAGIGEGVDAYYDKTARADNKFIGELESGEDAINYLKAFNQEDPNKIIISTLDDVGNFKDDLANIIDKWRTGDLDALDKNLGEKMRRETPIGYTALMIDRNKKWLPKIEAMLKTPEVEIVMVGSLHLSGKDGLLKMLKKDGYSIKTYKIAQ